MTALRYHQVRRQEECVVGPRVTETERLKHKVLIRLNDDMYGLLLDEARRRGLAPSIVARQVFAKGLSGINGERQGAGHEVHDGADKATDGINNRRAWQERS